MMDSYSHTDTFLVFIAILSDFSIFAIILLMISVYADCFTLIFFINVFLVVALDGL